MDKSTTTNGTARVSVEVSEIDGYAMAIEQYAATRGTARAQREAFDIVRGCVAEHDGGDSLALRGLLYSALGFADEVVETVVEGNHSHAVFIRVHDALSAISHTTREAMHERLGVLRPQEDDTSPMLMLELIEAAVRADWRGFAVGVARLCEYLDDPRTAGVLLTRDRWALGVAS